jgi:hypothetical protein
LLRENDKKSMTALQRMQRTNDRRIARSNVLLDRADPWLTP